jgi:hypothetical protein
MRARSVQLRGGDRNIPSQCTNFTQSLQPSLPFRAAWSNQTGIMKIRFMLATATTRQTSKTSTKMWMC